MLVLVKSYGIRHFHFHFLTSRVALALALFQLGLMGCMQTEPMVAPPALKLNYQLIQEPAQLEKPAAFSIILSIQNWPPEKPITFALPPYYADNPSWPTLGRGPQKWQVTDVHGLPLSAPTFHFETLSPGASNFPLELQPSPQNQSLKLAEFPAETKHIRYQIDLDSLAPGRMGLAFPDLHAGLQMVDGATLFLLPWTQFGTDISKNWRQPCDCSFELWPAPGQSLIGLPYADKVASPYALIFERGVLGNPRRQSFHWQGLYHGLDITLYATSSDTVPLDTLAKHLPAYLTAVENAFGPLPTSFLAIGEVSKGGGLEGTHGYWFGTPWANNAELHLHELVHIVVGIEIGDTDLPWFKEGITAYYGKWLGVRSGFIPPEVFKAFTLAVAANDSGPLASIPLGLAESRLCFYRPLDTDFQDGPDQGWYIHLYQKGMQAALLLDAWLLDHSQGRIHLYDVVRKLASESAPEFSRSQFRQAMLDLTGSSPDSILQFTSDGIGPFDRNVLQEAIQSLDTWEQLKAAP